MGSYAWSEGNILIDNTLPIEDLNSKVHSFVVGYVRSFKLLNKPAKFDAILPYSTSTFNGLLEGEAASTSRNGFGDPSFRLSMILLGAKALEAPDFFQQKGKKFKLGALLRVRVPLGQYYPERLINLGTNRYSIKAGLAGSYTFWDKLSWEVHFNSWFFTENKEFYNGNELKQKPLITLQNHFVYEFKPGIWAAISFGRSTLGETLLNGEEKDDVQNNSRLGAAFAFRLSKGSSIKIAATTGVTTRYGSDYTTLLLAYQFLWFDKYSPP